MIQSGTTNTPIAAIQAAINTQTTLFLGLWASAGQTGIDNEIAALTAAISQYGTAFTDLIAGISVGSEDLYRISPIGIENDSGVGAEPADLINYISQVRAAIKGTGAASALVGHVDTWTAYVNSSNNDLIAACDFLGMDAYPYFQNTMSNSIDNGKTLFYDALSQTQGASQGKPVWVTETGWPLSGDTENLAVPSIANAQTYWDDVACSLFSEGTNVWWYTLQDASSPNFGIVGSTLSTTPLFNLTCPAGASSSSTASSASTTGAAVSDASSVQAIGNAPLPGAGHAGSPAASADASATGTGNGGAGGSTVTGASGGDEDVTTVMVTYYTTYCPSSGVTETATKTTSLTQQTSFATVTATQSAASATGSSCPANLSGTYEYPHLIVPVNSSSPSTAYGTSYNGIVSSTTTSSLFNFDIPASDAGKTCSLVFLFPLESQLETSSYTLSGTGGIDVSELSSPATQDTTYSSVPAGTQIGSVDDVAPGNSYVIASGPCAAGQTVAYELSGTGSLDLDFFQDYNPSPLGLYITVC